MAIDVRVGDVLLIGADKFNVASVASYQLQTPSTIGRRLTATASSTRQVWNGNIRNAETPVLSSVSCSPPIRIWGRLASDQITDQPRTFWQIIFLDETDNVVSIVDATKEGE